MDIDSPSENYDFASFSLFMPLPYRISILSGAGVFLWALNLHGLEYLGVDVERVLGLSTTSMVSRHPLHHSIYVLSWYLTAWSILNWVIFRIVTHAGDATLVDAYYLMPFLCLLGLVLVLIAPFNIVFKRERRLFLKLVIHLSYSLSFIYMEAISAQ